MMLSALANPVESSRPCETGGASTVFIIDGETGYEKLSSI
jgi:hypothetical protein